MKKIITKQLALLIALIFVIGMLPISVFASAGETPVAIHLIGDSTVCMYSESNYPRWGWGQAIPSITNKNVSVFDWAISGASSRTIYEGTWSSVIDAIQEGDYLFIQFGHNDQKSTNTNVYAPLESENVSGYNTYEYYLNKFISETKAKGAHPIIVTSIERLNVLNKDTLAMSEGSLKPYADAAIAVANTAGIPYVDLRSLQREYLANCATYDEAFQLYMASQPGEDNYMKDYTHLTAKGATVAARLVFGDLARQGHVLADYLLPESTYNAGNENYYVYETFDGKQARGPLVKPLDYDFESYIFHSYNNYWNTSLVTEGTNNALKFNVNATAENTSLHAVNAEIALTNADGSPVTVTSGTIAYEYDVKFPVFNSEKGENFANSALIDSTGAAIYKSYLRNTASGAALTSATGTKYGRVSPYDGRWINVKNVVNLDTGLCLTYFDGNLTAKKNLAGDLSVSKIKFSGVPASTSYNEVSFDNVKVYSTSAPPLNDPALSGAFSEDINYLVNDDFDWDDGTYTYTTIPSATSGSVTSQERKVVHKSGSPITSIYSYHGDLRDTASAANNVKYQLSTDIVTDSDPAHGKVFAYSTPTSTWSGRRGIIMTRAGTPDTSKNFRVLEFDFKVLGGTGYNSDETSIYIAYGDMENYIKLSRLAFMSTAKKFSGSEDITNISHASYSAEYANANNLAADTWYSVKYLFDRVHRQYDMFINGVLVAQDCDMPTSSENTLTEATKLDAYSSFTIGMVYAYGTDTKSFYLDNLREYDATDEQALEIAKSGVEAYIGNEIYSSSIIPKKFTSTVKESGDTKEIMSLPYAGMTGFNYYASSTNPIYDASLHTPYASYTWSIPAESDFVVERKTFDWAKIVTDSSKPPYKVKEGTTPTYEMYKTWDLNYALNGSNPTLSGTTTAVSVSSLCGYSRIKYNAAGKTLPTTGDVLDLSFDLTANITKGSATGSVAKTIVLQRPVLPNTPEGIVIGLPTIGAYAQSNTQSMQSYFYSTIENKTSSDFDYVIIVGFYDKNDNLLYAIPYKKSIPAGGTQTVKTWSNPVRSMLGNASDAEFTKVDAGQTSTYFTKEQLDAARAIDQKIKYAKTLLWNSDDSYAPLMDFVQTPGSTYVEQ